MCTKTARCSLVREVGYQVNRPVCRFPASPPKMATKIPKMKLWYHHTSRSIRCTWAIKELGLDKYVEHKFVDIEAPTPPPEREEYRKTVHPHNTVPALEIEAPTMLESTAICLYLADLAGRLAPEPKERSEYYDWTLYGAIRMDEALERLAWQWWLGPKDQQDPAAIAKAKAVVDLCLDRMENTLKDQPYILGQELSIADCILGFNIWWAAFPEMNNGCLLDGYPNVKAYLERVKARPALKATSPWQIQAASEPHLHCRPHRLGQI